MADPLYILLDARSDKRGTQLYTREGAERAAYELNQFVHRNSGLGDLFPDAEVTGPFYPRIATAQEVEDYL